MGDDSVTMSRAEEILALHLRTTGLPWKREYRFAAVATGGTGRGVRQRLREAGMRDWRFDFALPDRLIAVEVEGGGWLPEKGKKSRHTTGTGFAADLRKYDAAARLGWYVYRCDPRMIRTGQALDTITQLLTRMAA